MHNNEITKEQFEILLKEGGTFALHFWAEWNGYDIEQKETIASLRKKHQNIDFFEMDIDVEDNYDICRAHKVAGPPTIVFYSKGQLKKRIVGVMSESQIENELQTITNA